MSSVFPILFLGTELISLECFHALLAHSAFEIKGVVTQAIRSPGRGLSKCDSPVALRAKELGLPVFTPLSLKAKEFLQTIRCLGARWVVMLSYGKILPIDFLQLFPNRVLNFHASLLPRWRGAAPIQRVLLAGDKETGMSLQVVKEKLDAGSIIGSRRFQIEDEMDAIFLLHKMISLIPEMMDDLILYMQNELSPTPQDESQTSYARKIDKKENLIVWSQSGLQIFNQIRAFALGPQSYTFFKKKRLRIHKAEYSPHQSSSFHSPAEIVEIGPDFFQVACQDSLIKIVQVQPESKGILSAGEYVRGYGLKKGSYFGE